MEDSCGSGTQSSIASMAQMTSNNLDNDSNPHIIGSPTRRNTFGPLPSPTGRDLPPWEDLHRQNQASSHGQSHGRARSLSKTDRSEQPVRRMDHPALPQPVAGPLRLIGSPATALSTIEGSTEHIDGSPSREGIPGHQSSDGQGGLGLEAEPATARAINGRIPGYATSRAGSASTTSLVTSRSSETRPGVPRTISGNTSVGPSSGDASGVNVPFDEMPEREGFRMTAGGGIDAHLVQTDGEVRTRLSFETASLKEGPPPPYDPTALLISAGEGSGSGRS